MTLSATDNSYIVIFVMFQVHLENLAFQFLTIDYPISKDNHEKQSLLKEKI